MESLSKGNIIKEIYSKLANNKIKAWFIKPGDNASLWGEFYEQQNIRIGWDKVVKQILEHQNYSEIFILEELNKIYPSPSGSERQSNNKTSIFNFLQKMKIGDVVFAGLGRSKIIGLGIINSDFQFEKTKFQGYKSVRSCEWIDNFVDNPKSLPFTLAIKTVTDISKDATKILDSIYSNSPQNPMPNFPLNLILYGPPGTGKTYSVKEKAVKIIKPDYPGDINEKFKELKEAGQIEFVTFHQAFAYEEFIEGLSAETKEGQISYKIKDGIFKRMAKEATISLYQEFVNKSVKTDFSFNNFYDTFLAYLLKNNTDSSYVFETISRSKLKLEKINENKNLLIRYEQNWQKTGEGGSLFTVYKNNLEKLFQSNQSPKQAEGKLKQTISQYFSTGQPSLYWAVWDRMIDFYEKEYNDVDLSDDLPDYKTIIGEIHKHNTTKKTDLKNYVLIIDEINRANISKVFGELITLLEDTKRLGADDEHTVRLPYSQDTFGVPKNLYLIGTMNTADRSIALLDIALRRRFEFEEMLPDIEKLKDKKIEEIELDKLLQKINQRIEFLLDRDHTIGHAYFLNISTLADLAKVFLNKIIPLLQEYFYDNWEKIKLVLSNSEGKCDFLEAIDYQQVSLFKKPNPELYLNDKKTSFRVKNLTQMIDNEEDKPKLISFFKGIYSFD